MKKLYMIGNTHFDPVWLWTWDEAMASIRATFRSALDRMNEDENFYYSFAAPPVFEWIKKTNPEMFFEIQKRVKEGRWELSEGWWLQPDCYSASGESYVRQGLYGQRYLMENFGQYSQIVFNVDSFGHSPMLPQILSKSGIKYYCMCRPEEHHYKLNSPLFKWESPDGSEVTAFRIGGDAGEIYSKNLAEAMKCVKDFPCDIMMVYGVTDHGGAPTKKAISEIHAQKNACFSTIEKYFEAQHYIPDVIKNEFITGDFGPYCNHNEIKRINRIAEYAALNAEKVSVISGKDNKADITQCWKDIMFNQFHDILGGASIRDAYFDARNVYGRAIQTAEEIIHTGLQSVTANICMPGKNPDNAWNVVVWNLNGAEYNDYIEAEVQWAHEFDWYDKSIALEDMLGNRYECQIIREKSVVPGFRSRFVFKATIPSVGYKAFKVIQTEKDEAIVKNCINNPYSIDTDIFKISLSKKNGSVLSVYDKKSKCELLKNMLIPACYKDDGDTWCFNVNSYGEKAGEFTVCSIAVTECGSLRTTLKITSKFQSSKAEIYYTFYNNENYFDVRYRINWNEKHMALKLDNNINTQTAVVSVPYGSINRKASAHDVPMGEWINADNVSILSDSIFAYNMTESKLGLTILRSPIYGDLRISEICLDDDYDIMEQGITEGSLRILCPDTWQENKTPELAEAFNNRPTVIVESNHNGILSDTGSYYSIAEKSVMLTAIKHCEADDCIIIRAAEYAGNAQKAVLTAKNKEYILNMKPYEIKTLKLCNDTLTETDMIER